MLVLPSVQALSSSSAAVIKDFVQQGGVLLITGAAFPGTMDELGRVRSKHIFKDDLLPLDSVKNAVFSYGDGVVIYRPGVTGRSLFTGASTQNPPTTSENNKVVDIIQEVIGQHVPENVVIYNEEGDIVENIYVELGINNAGSEQAIYILNLAGLKQPVEQEQSILNLNYRTPPGKQLKS
eukprot:Pgem_evm3s12621